MKTHKLSAFFRSIILGGLGILAGSSLADAANPQVKPPTAEDTAPVTQDQFRRAMRVLKSTMDRVGNLEKNPGSSTKSNEEIVDLNTLTSGPSPSSSAPGNSSFEHAHGGTGTPPNLQVYFDLNLINRPGIPGQELAFMNFHSFVFLNFLPDAKLQFSADLPQFNYYELDYMILPHLQVRAGRIWIPFDDLSPHSLFGGRVNVSALAPDGQTLLPTLWTDLGLGVKYDILDTPKLLLVANAYFVNGFGAGGTDPMGGTEYPLFTSNQGNQDTNRNKAIGGRLHATFFGAYGLGVSYYTGRWNPQTDPTPLGIRIFGVDAQARYGPVEFRTGMATATSDIPVDSLGTMAASRGGFYGEVGYRFGYQDVWKVLGRGGTIQLDDRVISNTDQTLVGATILRRLGPIEISLEHSRDLKKIATKTNYSLTNLRMVVAL